MAVIVQLQFDGDQYEPYRAPIVWAVEWITQVIEQFQQVHSLADTVAIVRVPDEFTLAIHETVERRGEQIFAWKADRAVGTVAAKVFVDREGSGSATIILNSGAFEQWGDVNDEELRSAFELIFLHLIGHELVHVLQHQIREVAGLRRAPRDGSVELNRESFMEEAAGTAVDEWRADALMREVFAAMRFRNDGEGTSQSLAVFNSVLSLRYREHIEQLVSAMYPEWPEIVWHYRIHKMSLDDMVEQILPPLFDLLSLFARLAGHDREETYLAAPSLTEHPAYQLYFADTWPEFARVLQNQPILPHASDVAEVDREAAQAFDRMATAILERLGLRITHFVSGQPFIKVDEPWEYLGP